MNKDQFFEVYSSIDFDKIVDNPNILIAARFWDDDRYQAARTCYKFMRTIDDMVDDRKAENRRFTKLEKAAFDHQIGKWLKAVRKQQAGKDSFQRELISTMQDFQIPLWPIEDFARAMRYDIEHDGFDTYKSFLDYSIGATVAPSSIFVHLCGLQNSDKGFILPPFDVKKAAIPCAMFSYLVHIIRDFQKDQLNHLNYFSDDLLKKNNLSRDDLTRMADGVPISDSFRNLIRDYVSFADQYRVATLQVIKQISPSIEPRYQLSLHIIFNLYLMAFERIDPAEGYFTHEELNPTAFEISERVLRVIEEFRPCF